MNGALLNLSSLQYTTLKEDPTGLDSDLCSLVLICFFSALANSVAVIFILLSIYIIV